MGITTDVVDKSHAKWPDTLGIVFQFRIFIGKEELSCLDASGFAFPDGFPDMLANLFNHQLQRLTDDIRAPLLSGRKRIMDPCYLLY